MSNHLLKKWYNGHNLYRVIPDPVYLTLLTNGYGSLIADAMSGYSGNVVHLTATPDEKYKLKNYDVTGATIDGNDLTFGREDCTAQANFERYIWDLSLQNDGHGSIGASKLTGQSGDTITLSNTPAAGYNFSGYSVTGASLNGSILTMNNQDAIAKAWFTAVPTIYYTDDNTYTATSPKTININKVITSTKYTVVQFEYKVNGRNGNYYKINPAEIVGVCTGNYHPIAWPNFNVAVPNTVYGIQSIWSNNAYYYKTLVGSAWAKHKFIYGRKDQGIGHDQTDVYINNTFMGEHVWNNGWYVSANSAINSITISGNNAQFTTTTASIRNIRIVGFNDLAAAQAYNG